MASCINRGCLLVQVVMMYMGRVELEQDKEDTYLLQRLETCLAPRSSFFGSQCTLFCRREFLVLFVRQNALDNTGLLVKGAHVQSAEFC